MCFWGVGEVKGDVSKCVKPGGSAKGGVEKCGGRCEKVCWGVAGEEECGERCGKVQGEVKGGCG